MSIRRATISLGKKFAGNEALFTRGVIVTDFLIIGGGGGGRNNTNIAVASGGGGAGAYVTSIFGESSGGGESNLNPTKLYAKTNYLITIGAGGTIDNDGSPSILNNINVIGGGRGKENFGLSNKNGGGTTNANSDRNGDSGTEAYMYAGGNAFGSSTTTLRGGGGGGGAGANGSNAASGVGGNGGAGLVSTITGSSVTRAGGGGGTATNTTTQGTGGSGGGGNAAYNGTAGSGTANTGSGGGGQTGSGTAGSGGSGIVIIKYPKRWTITAGAGLTLSTSTSGEYKITEFTAGSDFIYFS
jgi:hypothetical protein